MQGPSELGMAADAKLANWERTDHLGAIEVPTLVIGARYDTMDPAHMEMMAGRLPQGRYLYCPKGSHLAMYDDQRPTSTASSSSWVTSPVDATRRRSGTMTVEFTTRPTLRGVFGMVSSTHWLASASAMAVLEAGGNAFDAAVAAGFVLHVVEPHLNGPGGELLGVIVDSGRPGRPGCLPDRGRHPPGRRPSISEVTGLSLVPGAGLLAAAVPGSGGRLADAAARLRDDGTAPRLAASL